MPDTKHILDELRRRPAMYTGETSLESIQHFLSGYSLAAEIYDVVDPDDRLLVPREFHDWVAYRLHFYESTSGWCRMIRSKSSSESAAIERFFTLLEEFRGRVAHPVARLTGFKKNYKRTSYFRENDRLIAGSSEILPYPGSIVLVTYTDDPGFFVYSETKDHFPGKGFFPTMDSFESHTGAKRDMLTVLDSQWSP